MQFTYCFKFKQSKISCLDFTKNYALQGPDTRKIKTLKQYQA